MLGVIPGLVRPDFPGNDHCALRLVMADLARAMAMIIGARLFGPGNHIVPGSRCNELFVMHGTVMLLLFAPLTPPPGRGRRVQVPGFGLHGLTVCDAAWGCVMRGGSRTLAAPAEQVERWIVPGMSASAESMPSRQSSGPLQIAR